VDDRTGVVFEVADGNLHPRFILADGDGAKAKGTPEVDACLRWQPLTSG